LAHKLLRAIRQSAGGGGFTKNEFKAALSSAGACWASIWTVPYSCAKKLVELQAATPGAAAQTSTAAAK
jgi:hypothetical protein